MRECSRRFVGGRHLQVWLMACSDNYDNYFFSHWYRLLLLLLILHLLDICDLL